MSKRGKAWRYKTPQEDDGDSRTIDINRRRRCEDKEECDLEKYIDETEKKDPGFRDKVEKAEESIRQLREWFKENASPWKYVKDIEAALGRRGDDAEDAEWEAARTRAREAGEKVDW